MRFNNLLEEVVGALYTYSSHTIPLEVLSDYPGLNYNERHIRNNCGAIAFDLSTFLNKKRIIAKQVKGQFIVDVPDYGIKSFTKEEVKAMQNVDLNIHNENDRIKFATDNNLVDELRKVPHSWAVTDKYGIIDLTVKQFKKFMKPGSKITDANYTNGIEVNAKW